MSTERSGSEEISFENQFNFEKLHLNSRWSDVNFLFGSTDDAQRLPAHKMLLANESDIFAAMFYGELREKSDVTVADASIEAFKEFLQFFYLNRVKLTVKNVSEVMNLGHKYNVTKCVEVCVRFLKGELSEHNACVNLSLAILYDQSELQEYCEEFIAKHSDAVLKSKDFLECDKRVLGHILQMNFLSSTETVVFEACMSWVKARSKQNVMTKELIQEHLGELFYDIRFASMTIEEFGALSMAHDYAFSVAEYKDILHSFASSKVSPKLFNGNPRKFRWNEKAIVMCDRKLTGFNGLFWKLLFNIPTKFETNQPIVMGMLVFAPVGIYVDGQVCDLKSELPIDVTIHEAVDLSTAESTRTLAEFKINLPSRTETSITLPAPVIIQPGFHYEIRLVPEQCTDDYYRFQCGTLIANVQMENNISIKFHGDFEAGSALLNVITALGFNEL